VGYADGGAAKPVDFPAYWRQAAGRMTPKTITLPAGLYERVEQEAQKEGRTVDEMATEAVKRELARRWLERTRHEAEVRRGSMTFALHYGGKPLTLLDMAQDGLVELAISDDILTETLRILRDKFHQTTEWLQDAENHLREITTYVFPAERLDVDSRSR